MVRNKQQSEEGQKYEERVLLLRRVSKKTSGGNYISFSALVAIGDREGNVGLGLGRGLEVPPAIQKAITKAKKNMIFVPIYKDSLPHLTLTKFKSSRLLIKPAPAGTGLKVGGVVRAILDLAGVNNASGKIMGTRNQITNAYAVMEALKTLKPRITHVKPEPAVETPVVEAPVVEAAVVEVVKKAPKKTVKSKKA